MMYTKTQLGFFLCVVASQVVLINQVTTKVTERTQVGSLLGDRDGNNQLIPALGESWGHACTNRVILYWRDGQRYAHLHKCPSQESKTVPFVVLADGIRSLPPQGN
jgi:RAD51-like protein 2